MTASGSALATQEPGNVTGHVTTFNRAERAVRLVIGVAVARFRMRTQRRTPLVLRLEQEDHGWLSGASVRRRSPEKPFPPTSPLAPQPDREAPIRRNSLDQKTTVRFSCTSTRSSRCHLTARA